MINIHPVVLAQYQCLTDITHDRFVIGHSTSTLLFCPVTVDRTGKVVDHHDTNTYTTNYTCSICGTRHYKTDRNGITEYFKSK